MQLHPWLRHFCVHTHLPYFYCYYKMIISDEFNFQNQKYFPTNAWNLNCCMKQSMSPRHTNPKINFESILWMNVTHFFSDCPHLAPSKLCPQNIGKQHSCVIYELTCSQNLYCVHCLNTKKKCPSELRIRK